MRKMGFTVNGYMRKGGLAFSLWLSFLDCEGYNNSSTPTLAVNLVNGIVETFQAGKRRTTAIEVDAAPSVFFCPAAEIVPRKLKGQRASACAEFASARRAPAR